MKPKEAIWEETCEESNDEMVPHTVGEEGGVSDYEPMGQKPEKPKERATKSRRQSLESSPEPKTLSTVTFRRGLAASAWEGRELLGIPVWSRHAC